MFKVGDKVKDKKHCCCCAGGIRTIKLVDDSGGVDFLEGSYCSCPNEHLELIVMVKKPIKEFGIVGFMRETSILK